MSHDARAAAMDALLTGTFDTASLYDHAAWYDIDYQAYRAEVPFYRAVVDRFLDDGHAYVEIGAGTGRLSNVIAEHGHRVHAVEPAAAMRARLEEKVRRLKLGAHVTVEDARAHDFVGPDAPVGIVAFPFNGLLHLHGHDALDAFLARARARLAPDGVVAFDITGPAWEEMSAGFRAWGRLDERVHPESGRRVYTMDRSIYDDERRSMRTSFRYLVEGETRGVEAFIEQHMWTVQELQHAVHRAGFVEEMVFGDVDFAPLTEASPRLLLAARRRSS